MLTDNNTIFGIQVPAVPAVSSSSSTESPPCAAICCGLTLGLVCYAGIAAGCGAASGAIGYQVMATNGWTVTGITYNGMVQSMAAGAAVLSPLGFCTTGAAVANSGKSEEEKKKDTQSSIVKSLVYTGIMGAINGMTGAAMLQLLTGGEQVGFVAAAGAAGNGILVLSIVGAVGVLAAGALCIGLAVNGEPKLLVLPKLPGEVPMLIDPITAGMPIQTAQEMVNFVKNLPGLRPVAATPALQGAPVSQDMDDDRVRTSPMVRV